MTGDILERLKSWVYTPNLYQTQLDAAEEIESLRAEVANLKSMLRYEQARAEVVTDEADYYRSLSVVPSQLADVP